MKGYRISVIRHGRTAANDKGIYIGRTDFPLSDKGAAELAGKMDEFQYPNVARVYSSPLRRCTETAEILFPDVQIQTVDNLIESPPTNWWKSRSSRSGSKAAWTAVRHRVRASRRYSCAFSRRSGRSSPI